MTTTTSQHHQHHPIMPPAMRPAPVQESPVSRPRAVYSIDQILGNQHQIKRSGEFKCNKYELGITNWNVNVRGSFLQKSSIAAGDLR